MCQFTQIFGIYMLKENSAGTIHDVLQPGKNMVAAGYCMYGSSCTVRILSLMSTIYKRDYNLNVGIYYLMFHSVENSLIQNLIYIGILCF